MTCSITFCSVYRLVLMTLIADLADTLLVFDVF